MGLFILKFGLVQFNSCAVIEALPTEWHTLARSHYWYKCEGKIYCNCMVLLCICYSCSICLLNISLVHLAAYIVIVLLSNKQDFLFKWICYRLWITDKQQCYKYWTVRMSYHACHKWHAAVAVDKWNSGVPAWACAVSSGQSDVCAMVLSSGQCVIGLRLKCWLSFYCAFPVPLAFLDQWPSSWVFCNRLVVNDQWLQARAVELVHEWVTNWNNSCNTWVVMLFMNVVFNTLSAWVRNVVPPLK